MNKSHIYSLVLAIVLMGMFGSAVTTEKVEAYGTIYIRGDGSIEGTDKITSADNFTYIFIDNINDSIVIQRNDIRIDGNGYTLTGPGPVSGVGFNLTDASNVTIRNTNIKNFSEGIESLSPSSGNTIVGNNISLSDSGIYLSSSNNTIMNNRIYSNYFSGIYLWSNSRNNTILGNEVYLNSDYGVLLWSGSNYNILSENDVSNNNHGIAMGYSDDNHILNNTVSHGSIGIDIQQVCNNSLVASNMISGSDTGIAIRNAIASVRRNIVTENNITDGLVGIQVVNIVGSIVYHNNFVGNTNQTFLSNSTTIWDDGYPSGGNYWSNYTGVDTKNGFYRNETGSDGIGDMPYIIDANNTDNYPLMGMFSEFDWISIAAPEHRIQTICNSTISNLVYNGTAISFDVTGDNGTTGFCRICIPTALLNGTFQVFINGTETSCTITFSNSTHNYLYFNYTHSAEQVVIFVPEFPSFLVPLVFMVATLLTIIAWKRRHFYPDG